MPNCSTYKRDCWAFGAEFKPPKCQCLNELVCAGGKPCKFYKTTAQAEADRARSKVRLARIDVETAVSNLDTGKWGGGNG